MKYLTSFCLGLALLALIGCEKATVVAPPPAVVTQPVPVPVPGPPGPQGMPGDKGEPGKPGEPGRDVVLVPVPETQKQ